MEKVGTLSYILTALVFLFSFSGNLSTEHAKRRQLYMGAVAAGIFLFALPILYYIEHEIKVVWEIAYMFFAGSGILLPQLISRIFVRQNIKHPVIFLPKKKVPVIPLIITGVFFVFVIWVGLSPGDIFLTGDPLDYEFYVWWGFSLSVSFISIILMVIQMQVERDAICENGFYQGGLLSDWSNFKSYSWSQDRLYSDPKIQPVLDENTVVELTIEPKNTFFTKQIRLYLPFKDKNVVENILSKKFASVQGQ